MVSQVEDIYNTKDHKLKLYKITILYLLIQFDKYIIEIIPRKDNRYIDAMESVASLMPIDIEDEETIIKLKMLGHTSCSFKFI